MDCSKRQWGGRARTIPARCSTSGVAWVPEVAGDRLGLTGVSTCDDAIATTSANRLAEEVGPQVNWSMRASNVVDVVINATLVGVHLNVDDTHSGRIQPAGNSGV